MNVFEQAAQLTLTEERRIWRSESYFSDPVAWVRDMTGMKLWSKQREVSESLLTNRNVAVKAGHGVGKLVASETPVWTPSGFVLASDLRVGDRVFTETGETAPIVALSPVWDRPEYRVTFDDGSSILCGPEHEWNVLDLSRRTAAMKRGVQDWRDHWGATVTRETQELVAEGLTTKSGQNRWRIPTTRPLGGSDVPLPVDPYLLGFWLGDGSSDGTGITVGESKRALIDWLTERDYDFSIKDNTEVKGSYFVYLRGLLDAFRSLSVLRNKHIPMEYLTASEDQRRELLAGIMDSDGFTMKSTGGADVGIDLTSERLVSDVYTLLMTLGYKVRRNESEAAYTKNGERHVTGTRYRMNWTPDCNPFKIRGENWSGANAQRSRHTQRTVVSIEATGRRIENFCITIDSPRSLYLAGNSFVPTHNSELAALLICWWIDTRYPEAFVVSTAPSQAQISSILWRSIRKIKNAIEKSHTEYLRRKAQGLSTDGYVDHVLPGYITAQNEWKDPKGGLIGFGRKPPDEKTEDAVQGIHARYVLAVGDEAVGLQESMIDALGNITSNQDSRRLLIANPTNPASYFGKLFKTNTGAWTFHTISVLDSPNFTDEAAEMSADALAKLTGPSYVEDKKLEYGEDSPRYRSRVLGEFAYDLGDTLIKTEDVGRAIDTNLVPMSDDPVILGVDVARFGKDSSVIYKYQAGQVRYVDHKPDETRVTEVANWVHRAAIDTNATEVRVDGHGVGGGVVDLLVAMVGRRYTVISMNSNGTPQDRKQWHNNRAYWWDEFRRNLRAGELDLDPDCEFYEKLHDELTMVEYKFSPSSGGLLIESKDEMKKRGVKSPDFADAAIYCAAGSDYLYNGLIPDKQKIYQEPDEMVDFMPRYIELMTEQRWNQQW